MERAFLSDLATAARSAPEAATGRSHHADEHRPKRPVLLAVGRELGEYARRASASEQSKYATSSASGGNRSRRIRI
jgi:hypothetical protein